MIHFDNTHEFYKYVIGQDDDGDYEESGYVVVVVGDDAAIAAYSHCSCYDTLDSITRGGIEEWDWVGSVAELRLMLKYKLDPNHKDRVADPSDNDYDHLVKAYEMAEKWLEINRPL